MRSIYRLALGGALAGACTPTAVLADHPSLTVFGGPAGPVTTLSATPLPVGFTAAGARVERVEFDAFSDAEFAGFASADPEADVHSIDSLSSLSLSIAHGLTEDLTVGLTLPYVRRENIRGLHHHHDEHHHEEEDAAEAEHLAAEDEHAATEIERLGDSSGLGDAVLYGQYRFFVSADRRREAAVVFGLQTPTGKTDERGPDGERLETDLQPGSGSWDPLFGGVVSQSSGRLYLSASVLYKIATEGSQQTDLGDVLAYNAALSYSLTDPQDHAGHDHAGHDHSNLSLMLELNGEWRDQEEIAGVKNANSGGNTLYLSPGVSYSFGGMWTAALSVGVPVVTNLNGLQADPDWRAIAGISAGF